MVGLARLPLPATSERCRHVPWEEWETVWAMSLGRKGTTPKALSLDFFSDQSKLDIQCNNVLTEYNVCYIAYHVSNILI